MDGTPLAVSGHTTHYSIAVLTQQNNESEHIATAVLTFAVGEIDQANNRRVQILPDGLFKARDGRPFDVESGQWLMDAEAFTLLQANANLRKNDFHFDYEHQTLNSDENGKPAPAAGWFKNLEYVPGEGLFALDIEWTKNAAEYLANKEYRYTSAVFAYDTRTGRPVSLEHVALTNAPALDGMKAIEALKTNQNHHSTTNQPGDNSMNEALLLLLELLGVAEEGEDLSDPVALKAAKERAKTAIAALKTKADKSEQLQVDLDAAQSSITALKAKSKDDVDLTKYVPIEAYNAQLTQLAALKAEHESDSVEQLLKDNADKVLESEIQYLTDFGKQQGFAALKEMIEKRPAIAALKGTQTGGKKKPKAKGEDGELTTEQEAVRKSMGLTKEQFKKQLAEDGED